jgi:hypothetical protein
MARVSTIAVLRAHLHTLEMMAARCQELARRATDAGESSQLRRFCEYYELVALEHRRYLDESREDLAA